MKAAFTKSRENASREAKTFKASASEILSVYPLIRHFANTVLPDDVLVEQRLSLSSSLKVLDMLMACKRGQQIDENALREAMLHHFQVHVRVYGEGGIVPKYHHQLHIPSQAAAANVIADTFVLERKHQIPKQFADKHKISKNYERHVLQLVLLNQRRQARDKQFGDVLLGDQEICAWLAKSLGGGRAYIASRMAFKGATHTADDFVLLGNGKALQVLACGSCDSSLCLIGKVYHCIEKKRTSSKFEAADDLQMAAWIMREPVEQPFVWSAASDSRVTVLHGYRKC